MESRVLAKALLLSFTTHTPALCPVTPVLRHLQETGAGKRESLWSRRWVGAPWPHSPSVVSVVAESVLGELNTLGCPCWSSVSAECSSGLLWPSPPTRSPGAG